MKKYLTILSLLICIGVKGQFAKKAMSGNNVVYDYSLGFAPIPIDTFNKYWKPFLDSMDADYGQGDSLIYYRKMYKKYMALYTNSIGYKEVTRMGDSCRRYYQLLNRKK